MEKNLIPQRFSIIAVGFLAAISSAAWSAPAQGGDSDKALLKAGVLVSRDLPKGWVSRSVSLGSTNACRASPVAKNRALHLLSTSAVRPHEASTTPQLRRVLSRPKPAIWCASSRTPPRGPVPLRVQSGHCRGVHQTNEDEFKRRNPSATIAVTDFTPVSGLDTIGDDTVGYAATITASTSEQSSMTGPLDLIYVRVGRAVLGFKLGAQDQGVPQLADIIRHPVQRVEKAQR